MVLTVNPSLGELGKITLICEGPIYKEDDRYAWRKFWKTFRTHQIKQGVWSYYGKRILHLINNDYEVEFPKGIESLLDKCKPLGFYVDFFDNQFILPQDFAENNFEWLDWLFAVLDERIVSFEPLHGSLESSERFVNRGIKLFSMIEGSSSSDELKDNVKQWLVKLFSNDV